MQNRIVLAGGCFWGVEAYFQRLEGVIKTRVGYANGNFDYPTYQDLIKKRATHAEAVEILYDARVIPLKHLLHHMFRFIDPTSLNKQGGDIGVQYRTGIYYQDENDRIIAEAFIKRMQPKYDKPIVVEITPEVHFFEAEGYHQDYLQKNPNGYCHVDLSLADEPLKDEL